MWTNVWEFWSRRDGMIVAWQFTARNDPREDPSRRVRCDGYYLGGSNEVILSDIARSNRSYRSLRDGSFSCGIPGSKLPGYYHSVPTGQQPPGTCERNRLGTTFRARARDNPLIKSSLPSTAQSAARELTVSTPPDRLRLGGNVLRDPTFVRARSLYVHLRFRSGGCLGLLHPWRSPHRAGLETHAGNRLAGSMQKKCLTSDETRFQDFPVLAATVVQQLPAGSFGKKQDVRLEAPWLAIGVTKRRDQLSRSQNTGASESSESLVEPPPIA
jgi:hypothetical protein